MGGFGIIEIIFIIAMIASAIWVYWDAPKFGINRYVAVLATIMILYPLGFLMYLLISRLKKGRAQPPV